LNPAPRLALESIPPPPAGVISPDATTRADDDDGPFLVCARCHRVITTPAARVDRGGRHEHTFANPHGFVFHIGCFAAAPGCVTTGAPSTAHTWFPAHAWQVALCRSCSEHLGWLFSGPSRFHGLILDRLARTEGKGD